MRWWPLLVAVLLAATGCGGDGERLTVFAAASLADVMEEARGAFGSVRPDVEVVVSLAGSQQLAAQIRDGAPADVFLSADRRQLEAVADRLAGDPRVVATGELAIAVPPGNPAGITALSDLSDPGIRLVLPAPEVPAGAYVRSALEAAGVEVEPDDLTPDVRAAVAKVALGEADVAIVYRSDVVARKGEVEMVDVPLDADVRYYGAILASSDQSEVADSFLEFLTESGTGREILERHGFGAP